MTHRTKNRGAASPPPTFSAAWIPSAPCQLTAWLASLVLVLSGCASARLDTEAAVTELQHELPATWAGASEATPLSTSLLDLIDDERLRELVAEALEANLNLRAAAYRLAASRRLLRETEAVRWPFAEARAAVDRNNQGIGGLGDPTVETRRRASLGVAWEIDVWRRLADLHDENAALTQSQAADYATARDALGARVIQAWVTVISLRQAVGVEQERIEVLERLQETIQRRYRRGLGSLDDLAAARASTELSRATVAALTGDLEDAIRALELLLGRTPRAELLTAEALPTVAVVGAGYPADLLLRRHDAAAALWRLEAADAAAAAAGKAMLPNLRLTGDLTRDSRSFSDLLSSPSIWSVIGALTQPVFQRGLLKARADARQLELEAAWQDYRATVLTAIGEVEDALSRQRSLLRQHDHLNQALQESSHNLQIFTGRYRRGLASILELLQAKNQEMDLRRQVIAVNGETFSHRITLALALGAGFEELG